MHVNEKMVMCVLLDTVNAFPFIALCEISFNHFNLSHPRRKRQKTRHTCVGRRLYKKEQTAGGFLLCNSHSQPFEVAQRALPLILSMIFMN